MMTDLAPQLKNLRVLVIDDSMMIRELIHGILHAVGVGEIVTARNGNEALAFLEKSSADLAYVDWEMKPINGIKFLQAVRRSKHGSNAFMPIIMVTSHNEKSHVVEARDAGVHEYLIKPFKGREVLARLASVINNPRPFIRTDTYFGPAPREAAEPKQPG